MPAARGPGRRRADHDGGGTRARRGAAPSRAGGVPRDAWAPVRLLHAGRPSECGGTAPRHAPPRRRDDSPRPRRQPLPVHWLPEHRACRAAGRRVAGPAMTTRAIGARIPRNENPRLLRGLGCFVDDVNPAGVLHGAVLRSPHAHARIVSIDTARARALSGVELVLTAPDLGEQNQPTPLLIPHPHLTHPRTPRPPPPPTPTRASPRSTPRGRARSPAWSWC